MAPVAYRLTVPSASGPADLEDRLFDLLAEVPSSWSRGSSGELSIWTEAENLDEALGILVSAGASGVATEPVEDRDWVAESAALRVPVVVGRYVLDPHDGPFATRSEEQRRIHVPAARAFGTGSHESTRLALRLLQEQDVRGARVLDVGCGAGTLAFVASLEGAALTVAFDLDDVAVHWARRNARENRIERLKIFAGPLDALAILPKFDLVLANIIQEEVAPLLPGIRERLRPGGRLVTSGQLVDRQAEWVELLSREGFALLFADENEWSGAVSQRA